MRIFTNISDLKEIKKVKHLEVFIRIKRIFNTDININHPKDK